MTDIAPRTRHRAGWDALDTRMVLLATDRAHVLYLHDSGVEMTVRLIGWRGTSGAMRCRIEFANGNRATVPTAMVRPIPDTPTD